jgi:hypothetical protein
MVTAGSAFVSELLCCAAFCGSARLELWSSAVCVWTCDVRAIFGYLVSIFETDPRWLWRVVAAGGCGLAIAVGVILQEGAKLSFGELISVLILLPSFFVSAGCLLATIDNVRGRIQSGAVVGRWSRVLFRSVSSVWVWAGIVLVVGFQLAIFIGKVTWQP